MTVEGPAVPRSELLERVPSGASCASKGRRHAGALRYLSDFSSSPSCSLSIKQIHTHTHTRAQKKKFIPPASLSDAVPSSPSAPYGPNVPE